MRHPRRHWAAYLAYIRSLPCVVCSSPFTEAAHLRMSCRLAGKREVGMGEKPDDRWTLPLCSQHHREQHTMNESAFWINRGLRWPTFLSLALQVTFPDVGEAEKLIELWQETHGITGEPLPVHLPKTE